MGVNIMSVAYPQMSLNIHKSEIPWFGLHSVIGSNSVPTSIHKQYMCRGGGDLPYFGMVGRFHGDVLILYLNTIR